MVRFLIFITFLPCVMTQLPAPTGVPYGYTPLYAYTGVITSPNYPSAYPNNYHTNDTNGTDTTAVFLQSIQVPRDVHYIELAFSTFDVEPNGNTCGYDGLYISAFVLPLCGNTLPGDNGVLKIDRHQIKNDHLNFYFYTDGSQTRVGFYMNYRLVFGSNTRGTTSHYYTTTTRCRPVVCPYCPYGSNISQDVNGCSVCRCIAQPSSTQNPVHHSSLLLQILTNLEHRTETLEKSAHDLQEQLQLVLGMIKGGQD